MSKCFLFAGLLTTLVACGNSPNKPTQPDPGKACTEEAKVCEDGSSVGRTGPNCEFAPCPEPKVDPMPQPPT